MQIYFIILLFSDKHGVVKIYNIVLVMYFASYSSGLFDFQTLHTDLIGLLWVSNCLSMNVCSQTDVVREM